AVGAVPGPFDCFLVLRGVKTLAVRMERHCFSAAAVAGLLAAHPAVSRVLYPGLADHPGHEIAAKQMRDFGGMVSFTLAGGEAAATYDLRRRVLRSHQPGLPVTNPEDDLPETFHLAAVDDDGRVLGVVSFTPDGDRVRLRGMAVEPDVQGRGVGRLLMQAAVD